MSTASKRHHFLPQAFLRNFSMDRENVWVYDRVKKSAIFSTSVLNVGIESNLYTYLTKQKTTGSLEEPLFSKVDGMAKDTIDKLKNHETISDQEKADFALYIALLKLRVPDYQKGMDEGINKAGKKINMLMYATIEKLKKEGKEMPYTENEIEQITDMAKNGKNYRFKHHKNYWIKTMLTLSLEVAKYLDDMDWEFIYFKKQYALLTSDNPFFIEPPKIHEPFRGVGILTPGALKIVAITSNMYLLMGDVKEKPVIMYGETDNKDIAKRINLRTALNSDRFIYSPDKGKLEKLVKENKSNLSFTREKVIVD